MSERNWNGPARLCNLYGDDIVLERATKALPLCVSLWTHDRPRLRFLADDAAQQKSLFCMENDFSMAARPWTMRHDHPEEAVRCIMEVQPEVCGTLMGFKLYRPVLNVSDVSMLRELRDIVQRARPGEIVIGGWPQMQQNEESSFFATSWPIAVVAAAQKLIPLDRLVVPASPIFSKEQKRAISYQGLVLARDLFACWQ